MINKIVASLDEAVAGLRDGATLLVSGFGVFTYPAELLDAVVDRTTARDLTVVSNGVGSGEGGLARLLGSGRVAKVITSFGRAFPRGTSAYEDLYRAGRIDLEVVPQGTLSERIRAGGAGIGAFFTPTAAGTALAAGKEVRRIDGRDQVLEFAIRGDMALLEADRADRLGNLSFRLGNRNYGPTLALAADVTVVQARHVLDAGAISPDEVMVPGIAVARVLHLPKDPMREAKP